MNPLAALRAWRPVLRLARRDARRHVARTILASLLIALPIAALVGVVGFRAADAPAAQRVLASIPEGAQAVITARALPRDGSVIEQLPEGPAGPIFDDPETAPVTADEIAAVLDGGLRLGEYWMSPELLISPELGLAPGEQRSAGEGADQLTSLDQRRMSYGTLQEADPDTLARLAPEPAEGSLPANGEELLITRELAEATKVGIGDSLSFLAPPDAGWRGAEGDAQAAMQNSERGYRVVGIADEPGVEAWAGNDWLSGLVAAHPEGVPRQWLALGTASVTWDETRQLNALQTTAVSRHVLTHAPSPDELYPVPLDVNAYVEAAVGTVVVGVLGGLLVLFLVTPAFAVAAEESRRALGLAAASGAAPRDLRRMILAQGLVLGGIGGVLGAFLGFGGLVAFTAWLEAEAASFGTSKYAVSSLLANFPWWIVVIGVLLAVALGALAAFPPARTAARLPPMAALRDRRPSAPRRSRRARVLRRLAGPVILVAAAALGALALALPLGELPGGSPEETGPRPVPENASILQLLVTLAILAAAVGIAISVVSIVAWLGSRGGRTRPAIRFALRDAADHPTRTVPATLGVLFAVAVAAYAVLLGASSAADFRDSNGGGLAWRDTFMVSPKQTVTPGFDRLVVTSVFSELQQRYPQVTGALPVTAPTAHSTHDLQPLLPEDRTCPAHETTHVAAGLEPGAPMRCVFENSGAAYQPGFSFGGLLDTSNTTILSGDAVRATGLAGAEDAALVLDAGGIVVNNAALIDDEGLVRVAQTDGEILDPSDRTAPFERLPGAFLPGFGAPYLVSPDTAADYGIEEQTLVGMIAEVDAPIDAYAVWQEESSEASSLVTIAVPDGQDPVVPVSDPLSRVFGWSAIIVFAVVAVLAAAIAVLLAAAQGRRDAATMLAVGADRGFLGRLELARAGVVLAIGVPLGIAGGIGIGAYQVAWNRRLEASGAWLHTVPVWGVQFWMAAGVVVVALAAALLFGRAPRGAVRRLLD